jgi:hypothetical protein
LDLALRVAALRLGEDFDLVALAFAEARLLAGEAFAFTDALRRL